MRGVDGGCWVISYAFRHWSRPPRLVFLTRSTSGECPGLSSSARWIACLWVGGTTSPTPVRPPYGVFSFGAPLYEQPLVHRTFLSPPLRRRRRSRAKRLVPAPVLWRLFFLLLLDGALPLECEGEPAELQVLVHGRVHNQRSGFSNPRGASWNWTRQGATEEARMPQAQSKSASGRTLQPLTVAGRSGTSKSRETCSARKLITPQTPWLHGVAVAVLGLPGHERELEAVG